MGIAPKHILLVEDDVVFATVLRLHLAKAGYQVTHLDDAASLTGAVETIAPDAVILDGRLPSADGFDLCRELRPSYQGIIIMLTVRDEDVDEVLALELGADDYIRKPAAARIILAHLKACLRRGLAAPKAQPASAPANRLNVGLLVIDHATRIARVGGTDLTLTTAEFDLLWLLATHAGETLSRDDIFRLTRGLAFDGLDRSIDMRISRLRKLLSDDPANPQMIKTVRGKGYLFTRPQA